MIRCRLKMAGCQASPSVACPATNHSKLRHKNLLFFFGTKITGNTHLGTDLVSTLSSLNVHDFTHSDDVLMSQF